ncbi:MAG TPA: acyloxyacyl hydrolase [Chitinophagaceae bacterium]|nr:acyloxyacyl hydrolase [Chitinophagaceae bacterium]
MSLKRMVEIAFMYALVSVPLPRLQAQDQRAQFRPPLSKSYFGVNIGYINYPFSNAHLEPGYQAGNINVPHPAVRLVLYGYHVNKYISAQITYMRPVNWVQYNNINGAPTSNSVWMNIAGISAKARLPLSSKFSIYGEGGYNLVTRHGFFLDNDPHPVVKDVSYSSFLLGAGIEFHVDKKWDLLFSAALTPRSSANKQPHTIYFGAGFNFNMHPMPEEKVKRNSDGKYIFPVNLLQLGYTTNALGYGANKFVSAGKIPVFWGGNVRVEHGFSIQYQRNIFHGRKVFSLDWGANISIWRTNKKKENFFTLSVFPVIRFHFLHSPGFDLYFNYSVAGPAYISKVRLDDLETGRHFTFHDVMGMGAFIGKQRKMNFELKVAHYSNGNIFPQNEGVMIPLSFNFGYTFD